MGKIIQQPPGAPKTFRGKLLAFLLAKFNWFVIWIFQFVK